MTLVELSETLQASRGFAHKRDIRAVASMLEGADRAGIRNGDDCAVIPDGDGYLLFSIEGFLNDFVAADPWFAGYCAVMVNASDIYAMGGRPLAVVDALWSKDFAAAHPILAGMLAASERYAIPIVGGHTNTRSTNGQLAAAVLGRARHLLTSFDAQPGDALIGVIDLRGAYREPFPYWDASTQSPPERLRGDLELLPALAERGLCTAAKDISMGGVMGSVLMLLECSGVGADIEVDSIVRPPGVSLERWLGSFPSFGFVLSCARKHIGPVLELFGTRDLAASVIGDVVPGLEVTMRNRSGESVPFWSFDHDPLLGFKRGLGR